MLQKCIAIFLLQFSIAYAIAQSSYRLSVVDASNRPVPYATILWSRTEGAITDIAGLASCFPKKNPDTFFITAISYMPVAVPVRMLLPDIVNMIRMEHIEDSLPEIKIWPEGDPEYLGCLDTKDGYSRVGNLSSHFFQDGLLLEADGGIDFKLKSVSVFVSKKSATEIPFRIRIYDVDSNGLPATDLLLENVIVSDYKAGSWNEISLDHYELRQPGRTFVVATEWIGNTSGDGNYLWIGETDNLSKPFTYVKYGNTPWRLWKVPSPSGAPTNVMIKATIVYPKKRHQ
ncbi:MAG: hypothetical protein ABIX01_22275 [Chitinophagaceae bacterium]